MDVFDKNIQNIYNIIKRGQTRGGIMNKVDTFIKIFETKIIKGELIEGDKLPSERELSNIYDFSRQTIHHGLIRMEEKNLLEIIPRQGVFIKDYKKEFNFKIIDTLMDLDKEEIDIKFRKDSIRFFENILESVLKEAIKNEFINELEIVIDKDNDIEKRKEIVFNYFKNLCIMANNQMYIMLINSFKMGFINAINYVLLSKFKEERLYDLIYKLNIEIKNKSLRVLKINKEIILLIEECWIEGDLDG